MELQTEKRRLKRERYFVALEADRKIRVVRQLKGEIKLDEERGKLKRKIEEKIKKDVSIIQTSFTTRLSPPSAHFTSGIIHHLYTLYTIHHH
ncbi:hypothetical protein EON63_24565, partial [archaeon]